LKFYEIFERVVSLLRHAKQKLRKNPHDLKRKPIQTEDIQMKSKSLKPNDDLTVKDTSLQRLYY
jgi:hypothetical protein